MREWERSGHAHQRKPTQVKYLIGISSGLIPKQAVLMAAQIKCVSIDHFKLSSPTGHTMSIFIHSDSIKQRIGHISE